MFFIALFVWAPLSKADQPPLPQSKIAAIDSLKKNLEDKKQEKETLGKKVKDAEKALDDTKSKLVKIAKSIQKNEAELSSIEERTKTLKEKKIFIQENLDKERESLAGLVLALERIARMPPEAILAKPGAPLKTAQTAMLLQDVIPSIHERASALKNNLEELRTVTAELVEKQEKALQTAQHLKKEHEKLSGLTRKREDLYASTRADYIKQQKSIQKISTHAQNLQDLVIDLEKNKKRLEEREAFQRAPMSPPKTILLPKAGEPRLPVTGVITVGYNEKDSIGAPSKGLHIEGQRGALIVAPIAGIVRFAGPFKRFGNLVIIEHEKGYHSLVAGFEKIDTVVGHSVGAGEPLGFLSKTEGEAKPTLYFELRYKGRPVNPAQKFSGLG